jgi:hypothetical protein
MPRRLLLLMVLALLLVSQRGLAMGASEKFNHSQTTLEWLFNARNDRDGNPNTSVYLVMGGQRYFVMRDTAQFSVVERDGYREHGVPASAVAACASWWAGSGEELYVIRRGRQLIVYIRYLDEQSETGRYKRLKVITLRR